MVSLVRERVAAEEQDEGGPLRIDVSEGPLTDAVTDDVGDHGNVLREEKLVELLEQGGEDDLPVAAIDGVDQIVLAVEVDARLAEASEALDGGAALAQDLTRRIEPGLEEIVLGGSQGEPSWSGWVRIFASGDHCASSGGGPRSRGGKRARRCRHR